MAQSEALRLTRDVYDAAEREAKDTWFLLEANVWMSTVAAFQAQHAQ